MQNLFRPGKLGDVCILLCPTTDEVRTLHCKQATLQSRFGGHISGDIHITCQRFSIQNSVSLSDIIRYLKSTLSIFEPFPIMTDSLLQFYSSFWKAYMLRWRIQKTSGWEHFLITIESILESSGYQPHYPSKKATTCTALALDSKMKIDGDGQHEMGFPYYLFTARQVKLSQIKGQNEFETLEIFQLRG